MFSMPQICNVCMGTVIAIGVKLGGGTFGILNEYFDYNLQSVSIVEKIAWFKTTSINVTKIMYDGFKGSLCSLCYLYLIVHLSDTWLWISVYENTKHG